MTVPSSQTGNAFPITEAATRAWSERIRVDTLSNYHLEMARAIAREGNVAAAIDAYQRAIATRSGWGQPCVELYLLLRTHGRVAEAEAVRQSAGLDATYFDQLTHSAGLRDQARALMQANKAVEAVALLEEAYACDSDAGEELASALLAAGIGMPVEEAGRAVALLERSAQVDPDRPVTFQLLGDRLFALRRIAEAEAAYSKLCELRPSAQAFGEVGLYRQFLLRFPESEEALRMALRLEPSATAAQINLAVTLSCLDRFDEAMVLLEELETTAPGNRNVSAERGLVLLAMGRVEDALAAERQSLALAPPLTTPFAWFPLSNLGLIMLRAGKLDEALRLHRTAVGLAPNQGLAWSNLGLSLQWSGAEDEGMQAHRRAARLQSAMMPFWFHQRRWASKLLRPVAETLGIQWAGR